MIDDIENEGLSVQALIRQRSDFAAVKANEIEEARQSWRYYHSAQYTDAQLAILEKRGQPAIVFDRLSRKIDGIVGITIRLRADPKAFPRTPQHQEGADLSTAVLNYVLDTARWSDTEWRSTQAAAVHGVGVVEMGLEPGDTGDADVTLAWVDPATFFYDPRSVLPDFSDARYMGVARDVSPDELDDLIPGASELVQGGADGDLTAFDLDRSPLWTGQRRKLKLVEHWYRHKGQWKYCIYVGSTKITGGVSPFVDEKGKTICRYIAWHNAIDHDGDRYGFVRRLKGPQDAINQHRSKAMHIMNTRQVVARKGALDDVEATRREAARPDGVIEYVGERADFSIEQPAQEFIQQTTYFQDAKSEIENYGPNPAIVGTGVEARSGRALAMMQQSGLAEIGPFLANWRSWKLRVYRAVWNAIRQHWTQERWIRVTDEQDNPAFIPVNKLQIGPIGPQIVNALGALDVDIILDEGPDTTNVMGDVYDTLSSLAQSKFPIPPAVLIEMSALPKATKERILGMLQQQDPAAEQAKQVEIAGKAADIEKTRAETAKLAVETGQKQLDTAGRVAAMAAPQQMVMDYGSPPY